MVRDLTEKVCTYLLYRNGYVKYRTNDLSQQKAGRV